MKQDVKNEIKNQEGKKMNLQELLSKQVDYSFKNEDWYPPLKAALEGLTAAQANWKPDGVAINTIWENASHILYFKERLVVHIKGEEFKNIVQSNDDTFTSNHSDKDWKEFLIRVHKNHDELQNLLSKLNEKDLLKEFKGRSFAKMISSINMHDAYHTGQIIQIRKLQGTWAPKREC